MLGLAALRIDAANILQVNLFRVRSAPLVADIVVSPSFRAGTPDISLPHEGLEIRAVGCANLTGLVSPQNNYGDILIDEVPCLTTLDIAVLNAGDIFIRTGADADVSLIQFDDGVNSTVSPDLHIRKLAIYGARLSTSQYAPYDPYGEPYRKVWPNNNLFDPHSVGTLELAQCQTLSPRLFFRNVKNLVLQDNSLLDEFNGTDRWQHYNMESFTWWRNLAALFDFPWPETNVALLNISGKSISMDTL